MRKAVVSLLIAVLSLSMLVALAGCGDDANKDEAMRLMREGDRYVDEKQALMDDLEDVQNEIVMAATGGDVDALTGDAVDEIQQEIGGLLDGMAAALQNADATYRQILALDGVEDYKEYAEKMLEAVEAFDDQVGYIRSFVMMLVGTITEMAEAGDLDLMALLGLLDSEEYAMIEEAGDRGTTLEREAATIKKDKKLES